MTTSPLDYSASDKIRPSREWPWRILISAVFLLGVYLLLTLPVRQDESKMDPVTGSMISKTVWLDSITLGPRFDVSPLEVRLKNSGVRWTPSWRFLHNTHRNVFGRATCRECGQAPVIYELQPAQKEYTAVSTDAELREFAHVMQSGTDAQQQSAVHAAVEKALESLYAN